MKNQKWIWLFFGFLIIMNGLFISIELYKEQIRNQWMDHQLLAEKAFIELNQLSNWTLIIESTLSISILVIALWMIIKKRDALNLFLLINIITCLFFLAIGSVLAMYFETAIFNLVQQLLGPIFILIIIAVYQVIKKFSARYIAMRN